MAIATVPLVVQADCPYDFADVNELGERLLRVLGPPQFPGWSAEYEVRGVQEVCALCDQPIHPTGLRDTVEGGSDYVVASLPDNSFRWAHVLCCTKVLRHRTPTQGWKTMAEHPDCAVCGEPWAEHWSFGYETRSCTDQPDDTRLYHRAPGLVGVESPEWLHQRPA